MTNIFKFIKGLMIKPKSGSSEADSAGELEVLSSDNKLRYHNGSSSSPVVTESHSATLTNKTIDADDNTISDLEVDNLKSGVLNTDAGLTGATDLQIPSALAVKTLVENSSGAVQADVDDLVTLTGVPVNSTDLGTFTGNVIPDNSDIKEALQALETEADTVLADVADLVILSGVPANSQNLGTFTGTTIPDNSDNKEALQALETGLEAHINDTTDAHDASAISNVPAGTIAATDVQAAINELDGDIQGHINDTTDAHDASAISVVPTGNLGSTDVQSALVELQGEANTANSHIAASQDVHGIGVGSSVVGTATSQTLTNKIITGADIRTPVRSDVKQDTLANLTTYASTASNGQLVFATDTKEMYQVVDGALEAVGAGGGAADVNALLIQTFDDVTTGDFTQTGLALVTSNTINGAQTARLIHQAGTSQSFKEVKAVDRKFRSQLMLLSLSLQSTASQGNVTLTVYDETNAANIVASEQLTTGSQAISSLSTTNASAVISGFTNSVINTLSIGQRVTGSGIPTGSLIISINTTALTVTISQNATATASGLTLRFSALPERQVVGFTIPASCASLSYTITAALESGSPETYVDDLVIELDQSALLETSVEVPVVTAWQGYTPTFQGFGTPTNVEFEWRQVGENVEIRGKFTAGTTTGVEARVGLPAGLTSAGTSIIPSLQMVGAATRSGSSAGSFVALIEPSVTYLTFGAQTVSAGGLTKAVGTFIATSESLSFFASVPCAGLSATQVKEIPLTQSGLIQEADSMITLHTANGYGSTGTRIPRFSVLQQNIGSDILYQDSATNGASFTVQTSGIYSINFVARYNASLPGIFGLSKNSSSLSTSVQSLASSEWLGGPTLANDVDSVENALTHSWTGYLVAGDVVRPHTNGVTQGTVGNWTFTIAKQGSLKQVSVITNQKATIPTSELRFEGASSRGAVATTIVRFDTQSKLRGDAFSIVNTTNDGTAITMLKAGRLSVSATVYINNASGTVFITRNQQSLAGGPVTSEILSTGGSTTVVISPVSWTGDVNVGDVIRIASNLTPSANSSNQLNLSFQEQSVQVSVSNVLPQFSESDSSIRLDTANGYGSTATRIRRFTNTVQNIGSDITYTDSATAGASFLILESGVYNISYNDQFSSNSIFGISLNASSLTTDINSLAQAEVLALSQASGANIREDVNWSGYLSAGDIIRPHTDGTASGVTPANARFTISKVGKPNVTGVDVTPFVEVPQPESQQLYISQTATLGGVTITGALTSNTGASILSYNSSTGVYTALKRCDVVVSASLRAAGAANVRPEIQIDGVFVSTSNSPAIATQWAAASYSGILQPGQTISIVNGAANNTDTQRISVTATALSDQILTAPETFSTDTAALQYASSAQYTLSTLANAPVGTYITFTYAANTNTRTQTTTRPTQTDADMNTNGVLITARAYNAAGANTTPNAFAIQIGKGLKGIRTDGYAGASKTNPTSFDLFPLGTTIEYGIYNHYDEKTGILYLDAGYNQSSTITNRNSGLDAQNNLSRTTLYLVINASKNPALTGLGLSTVAARGINTAGTSIPNSGNNYLVFDSNKTYDTHGALNTSSGIFTAPESGYYNASWGILFSSLVYAIGNVVTTRLELNGVDFAQGSYTTLESTSGRDVGSIGSTGIYLKKGDVVKIRIIHNRTAGAATLNTNNIMNFFSIHKTSLETGN